MRSPRIKIALTAIAVAILTIAGLGYMYTSDFYRAAIPSNLSQENPSIAIIDTSNAQVISPRDPKTALIFYPGGKVEHTAYAPLMVQIANHGILCIVPKMPFNLAVLNANAADEFLSDYSEIEHWYIGGHSLGGSMAASYVDKTEMNFEGIVLLASYSVNDISQSGLRALSVYGSRDRVLNLSSYKENKSNLPANFREIILEGGNHAGFGAYGNQDGDGTATIPAEQQWEATADAIAEFCELDTSP